MALFPTQGLGIQSLEGESTAQEFDVLHYDVEVEPNIELRTISGSTTIRFRAGGNGVRQLAFSANELAAVQASMAGEPVQFERTSDRLVFRLPRPVRRGQVASLRVSYGPSAARGIGFADGILYTNYSTCSWMICNIDVPGDTATLSLSLRLPSQTSSVASGTRVADNAGRPGWRGYELRIPRAPHLFGFAAGYRSSVEVRAGGVTLAFLGNDSPADLARIFAPTARMLGFFVQRAGVPLRPRRYSQLLIAGSEAQEKAEFSIIGHAQLDPMSTDPQEDWAIAHELAHQWWGGAIVPTTWQHMWISEGLVTFMVAAWKEHRWGRAAYDREMGLLRRRLAAGIEQGLDRPLSHRGSYGSLSHRRLIHYAKGALFFAALRTEMGDAEFWRGLRRFTTANYQRAVEPRDVLAAFQAASSRNLRPLFVEWVGSDGGL